MNNTIKLLIMPLIISISLIIPIAQAHTPIVDSQGKQISSLAPMLEKVTPAVVKITVEKIVPKLIPEGKNGPSHSIPSKALGLGSGVVIDAKEGLIVTNAHVVSHGRIILATLKNGRNFRARIVGEDDGFDIAVIKIDAKNLNLDSLAFGDSDQLQVGDYVAAVGSPFGLTQTVTSGVVSALNRDQPQIEGYQSFIQTDTPINPGNSGGALVNMNGELIGINTAIFAPSQGNVGIGFAIPSNMVKSVIEQLLAHGKVSRGVLGMIAQNITPSLAIALGLEHQQGAMITKVIPNSPADEAGLKIADIIDKLNDKPVRSAQQLRNSLGLMPPGSPIKLTVIRQSKTLQLSTRIGSPKSLLKQHALPFIAGLQLQNFDELEGDGSYLKGVVVTGVSEMSSAALSGLHAGDVIIQANQKNIESVMDLKKIAENENKQLLLQVARGDDTIFLVIEKEIDEG